MMAADELSGVDLARILDVVEAMWDGSEMYAVTLVSTMGPTRTISSSLALVAQLVEIAADASHVDRYDALAIIREAVAEV